MLIPNLSVLLAQRRLTISRASQDTGISRTTLTSLASGAAKGIQFDTLNALCQYLKVTPGDFFLYRPFDLAVHCDGILGRSAVDFILRCAGRRAETAPLPCDAQLLPGDPPVLRVRLSLPENFPQATDFLALLQALPAPILTDLEFTILRAFDAHLPSHAATPDYSPELLWPWQP